MKRDLNVNNAGHTFLQVDDRGRAKDGSMAALCIMRVATVCPATSTSVEQRRLAPDGAVDHPAGVEGHQVRMRAA